MIHNPFVSRQTPPGSASTPGAMTTANMSNQSQNLFNPCSEMTSSHSLHLIQTVPGNQLESQLNTHCLPRSHSVEESRLQLKLFPSLFISFVLRPRTRSGILAPEKGIGFLWEVSGRLGIHPVGEGNRGHCPLLSLPPLALLLPLESSRHFVSHIKPLPQLHLQGGAKGSTVDNFNASL